MPPRPPPSSPILTILPSVDSESHFSRVIIRSLTDCLAAPAWHHLRTGFVEGSIVNEDGLNVQLQSLGMRMIQATDSIQGVEHKEKFEFSQQSWFSVGTWAQLPVVQALRARVDEQTERRIAERGAGEEAAVVVVEQDRRKRPRREARASASQPSTNGSNTSRKSQKLGPCKPDGAIITIGNPVMVFGFREDKLHFWHRNDPFGLTWAHREGIYQSIFYMHLTSQLCGTRLGMLVVNTAFQRMALLDDGVIAIERSSLNIPRSRFSDESYTIDQLDDDLDFWTSIPNTLLSPDGTATTTMTRSSTSTSTDTRSLKYLVPAQKRYIRFFQSIYHIAALTKIPTSTERRNSPLPRPLQCVRPGLAAADLAELLTFGGGSPTPVPLPRAESLLRGSGWSDSLLPRPESSDSFPTRLESASDISSPSRPKPGSNSLSASNAQAIPQETSPVTQATPIPDPYLSALPQTRWALLPNTSAESIAQASMRKHDYAGLRAKARAGGKREAEREDREGGRTRGRDDETDEEDDGTARDRGTSEGGEGAGVERNSGVGGDGGGREGGDGHREGSGEGEHDAKGGQGGSGEMGSGSGPGEDGARGRNSTRPNDAGDQAINHASITSLSPITPGADDRLHLFDSTTPRHDPLHRATMMPPHHARPQEAMTPPRHSVQHTTPTPPLTHPATPDPSFDTNTTDDSSTPTSLELYRDRLRLAGVRITMVVPEAMDRVVWRIATGRAVNSMSGRITGQEVVSGQPVVSKSGGFAGQPLGSKARQVQRVGKQMVV